MGTSIQEQVDIKQVISSREYSWHDKIVRDKWNRIQVEREDVSSYNITKVINQKSNIKPDESILGKAYNKYKLTSFIIIILTRLTQMSRYVN